MLVGPNGARIAASLIVDTGASAVVLPTLMMEPLGFKPEDLSPGVIQTANGAAPASRGTLAAVEVGGASVKDVAVTFLDDQRLAGHPLLGMSFLGRFRLTVDAADSDITLAPR